MSSNRDAKRFDADKLAQGEARGGMLTTVAAFTQLLVAVHSVTHDVQSQHNSTLLALHAMSRHLSQHCKVGGKGQLADCTPDLTCKMWVLHMKEQEMKAQSDIKAEGLGEGFLQEVSK